MKTLPNIKPLYVFGDTHLGCERSGGTTPTTKAQLKVDLLEGFRALLANSSGSILINGDAYDTDKISLKDLFESYQMLSEWLADNDKLYLAEGNHCASGNTENTSSFDLLCKLLQAVHGDKVVPIYGAMALPEHDAYVISSVRNQDLFDVALLQVPQCSTLYLHANYANFHAVAAQHSLNLTEAQAKALPVKRVVMSHEHAHRKMLGGKVHLIGAPFCSSVSDCIASPEKYMVKVTGSEVEYITTWKAEGDFIELPWKELKDTGARFVRVIGAATAEETSDAVSAISRLRSTSKALVITNAVVIGNALNAEELAINAETVTAFNVKEALFDILSGEEVAVVKQLLGE